MTARRDLWPLAFVRANAFAAATRVPAPFFVHASQPPRQRGLWPTR